MLKKLASPDMGHPSILFADNNVGFLFFTPVTPHNTLNSTV
jgi:hypothetical protein